MAVERSPRRRAQGWLEAEVARMWESSAPPQRTAASERALRHQVALLLLPLEPYVGLTLEQAQQRARAEGRQVVDRTGEAARRLEWQADRVNVVLDDDGRVRTAETDGAPWDR